MQKKTKWNISTTVTLYLIIYIVETAGCTLGGIIGSNYSAETFGRIIGLIFFGIAIIYILYKVLELKDIITSK